MQPLCVREAVVRHGILLAHLSAELCQPIQRSYAHLDEGLPVGIKSISFLHRYEIRQGPVVALDEDPLAGRGRVQDLAEALAHVHRRHGSHSR